MLFVIGGLVVLWSCILPFRRKENVSFKWMDKNMFRLPPPFCFFYIFKNNCHTITNFLLSIEYQ